MIKILGVELFEATFTKLETTLSSPLYKKHFRNLEARNLSLLGIECIVW